jgi:hypothetical protein
MTLTTRVSVRLVRRGDRRDVAAFVDLPERLHAAGGVWAPPGLRRDAIRQLHRSHPFHQHSSASFFVAEHRGRVVGRIAAIENRRYNVHHGTRAGFFGSFETVDDEAVSTALFSAALDSLRRRNLTEAIGPRGVSGLGETLLVEGFEHRPVGGVAWNPPYYEHHVLAAGFEPMVDFRSGRFPSTHRHRRVIHDVAQRARLRSGFETMTFQSRAQLKRWLPRIIPVFLDAMSETVTFYPPTRAEIDELVRTILLVVDPRAVTVVLKRGRVVGFVFAYPDLGEVLARTRGRLAPFGWADFLTGRDNRPVYAINGVGVLAEHRGFGANALLYSEITRVLLEDIGVQAAEVVQVATTNRKSFEDMTALGVTWNRTHRLYRKEL